MQSRGCMLIDERQACDPHPLRSCGTPASAKQPSEFGTTRKMQIQCTRKNALTICM